MKIIKIGLAAILLASPLAFAQAPAGTAGSATKGERAHKMHEHLKAADKNGDGMISREEANASLPRLAKHFDQIDTNQDGQITREEMKAFREKRKAERAAKA